MICGGKSLHPPVKFQVPNSKSVLTVGLCELKELDFVSGGGYVELLQPPPGGAPNVLRFWTGQGWPQPHKPAWGLQCRVDGVENQESGKKWEYGFIQTAEKLSWRATYSSGGNSLVTSGSAFDDNLLSLSNSWELSTDLTSARDCMNDAVRAPWYFDDPTKGSSPDSLFDPMVSLGPTIADEPAHSFPISHPHDWARCTKLQEVVAEGKFNVWVIVRDRDVVAPVLERDIIFLHWISISFAKGWVWKGTGLPNSATGWFCTGTQTKKEGAGRGKELLVLDEPSTPALLKAPAKVTIGRRCPGPVRTNLAYPKPVPPPTGKLLKK
ncbi:MAG TPA: hypothetical protein VEQ63_05955 [Bryobacteraceae bacterium]|nr:hypothetical protein [Bryobacteraceae bacterium]